MSENKMARVELDVAFDEGTVEQAIARVTAGTGITAAVRAINGPGGGWPAVEFTGTRVELEAMIRDFFADSFDGADPDALGFITDLA